MPTYQFSVVAGSQSPRRAVGFIADDERNLNAASCFALLKSNYERTLRTRFDHWIDGNPYPKYYHGWPDLPKYKECWVFKWDENKVHHRLYGFLWNPRPRSVPKFRICALAFHDTKVEGTNFAILDWVNNLRANVAVLKAIRKVYPE